MRTEIVAIMNLVALIVLGISIIYLLSYHLIKLRKEVCNLIIDRFIIIQANMLEGALNEKVKNEQNSKS